MFLQKINATLNKEEKANIYQTITRADVYDLDKSIQSLKIQNEFTNWVLLNGGFEWKQIDQTYVNNFLDYYNQLGFWDIGCYQKNESP